MNDQNKKLIEIDLIHLLNILYRGIWTIITFVILGLLIGYIYEQNYKRDDVVFRAQMELWELSKADQIHIDQFNKALAKLSNLEYEKSFTDVLTPKIEMNVSDDIVSAMDKIVKTNIQKVLKSSEQDSNISDIKINSKELLQIAFQISQKSSFAQRIFFKYNDFIKGSFPNDKEKVELFSLKLIPDLSGYIGDNNGVENYTVHVLFSEEVQEEYIGLYFKIFIDELSAAMNQQVIGRFKMAEDNYYYEVENMKSNLKYSITTIKNEYKISLQNTIKTLTFQRDIAFDLGYENPIVDVEINSEKDYYKRGYLYLDKEIKDLKMRLDSDFDTSISEIRFYRNALKSLDRNVTLNRAIARLKEIGLIDNNFDKFEVSYKDDNSLIPNFFYTQKQPDSLYAVPFAALLGLIIGIIVTINSYLFRKRMKKDA
ncbi:MAG: hypothetical protein CFH18_00625 [Alphaproteobacteria bacterium MarineAlpha5_Bin8]|nr:MAG: hypothetical protein CFH18_00625 [Alphaproteobacteria bacterium MarineAlpha5_Bin8]PPR54164.1 MAG: hypothetical protein CFH16_00607 [Alphaproteobacteria bacterium MarineAlpha5_Bin6]|tara:strand:- start:90 stop:1370 length:1281 start_codon:yes stop_codon:yes gene_type:complete